MSVMPAGWARALALGALAAAALWLPGWAGSLAAFVWLGALPGLALVARALPRAGASARWTLGLAIAPLLAAPAGGALHAVTGDLRAAALLVAGAAGVAWVLPRGTPRAVPETGPDELLPRGATLLALGLAAAVALPYLVNPYVLIRGDSWTHAAIVAAVQERGLPPEDPRFAGVALNYAWFYNLFLALASALRGEEPFRLMALMNVAVAFALPGLAAMLALRLWHSPSAATGAAALLVLGLNAGAFLLWPLRLVRAFFGAQRGPEELALQLRTFEAGTARVIYGLSAPFAHMVSFLDKLLVGSPLAYGYLLMLLFLWALLRGVEDGDRGGFAWLALAAAGMMLFHGVVGLSVIPVALGALALALVLRPRRTWLPTPRRLAAAGLATLAGALATAPYMLSASRGWRAEDAVSRHSYLGFDPFMAWTLATACAFALGFAWRPALAAWRERRAGPAIVALFAAAMLAFALIVILPLHNQSKFVFQVFAAAAVLAAPAWWEWIRGALRSGSRAAAAGIALLFLTPCVLTIHGYAADPGPPREPGVVVRPGEPALERWIREHSPRDAVFVENGLREVIMVRGRRALYLGTSSAPEFAGWPAAELFARRRVIGDLFGPGADLPGDLASLERLRRPVFLVFRPEDDAGTAAAWARLRARTDRFALAYEGEGYRVLRLLPEAS